MVRGHCLFLFRGATGILPGTYLNSHPLPSSFETGPFSVALTVLELTMHSKLALNVQKYPTPLTLGCWHPVWETLFYVGIGDGAQAFRSSV